MGGNEAIKTNRTMKDLDLILRIILWAFGLWGLLSLVLSMHPNFNMVFWFKSTMISIIVCMITGLIGGALFGGSDYE